MISINGVRLRLMAKTQDKKPSQDWPGTIETRAELDQALDKGKNGGRSDRSLEDIYREAVTSFKNA